MLLRFGLRLQYDASCAARLIPENQLPPELAAALPSRGRRAGVRMTDPDPPKARDWFDVYVTLPPDAGDADIKRAVFENSLARLAEGLPKLAVLADRYGIDLGAEGGLRLAWAIANEHVPGFAPKRQARGRMPSARVIGAAFECCVVAAKRPDMSDRSVCEHVAARRNVGFETLRKTYAHMKPDPTGYLLEACQHARADALRKRGGN